MKRYSTAMLVLVMLGVLVSGSAIARGGRGGGGHAGGGHSGATRGSNAAGPSHAPNPARPSHGPSLGSPVHAPSPVRGPSFAPSHVSGGGVRYGIALGVPLYGLGYYGGYYPYPYTYSDPAYRYPGWGVAHPREYIEQGIPNQALQPQDDWFYCADSKAYYPYVRECPGGWQRVPSTPPR